VCRKVFDATRFKVLVSILNNHTDVSNTVSLSETSILNVLDRFDITFDIENVLDLDSILTDLGMSLTDFDTGLLNTE
jgi:hypothetical protein